MQELSYSGGCLCGALRYRLDGEVRHLCFCHCTSCRRAAGAPMVPWGTVSQDQFHIERGALTEYRSSAPVLRGFCATCGSGLTYRNAARPQEIDVALATLDEPARLPPRSHVWVADKLAWIQIADGLPQYAGGLPPAD